LLWEMTKGDVIQGGWSNEHVKQSLDLCLACKGCKSDCPVSVDVATYKAEFLSHYYERRRRPLNAYAFGNIDRWARVASQMPGLVNLATQLPFLRDIAKLAAGIAPQRRIPPFAPETFKAWFRRRGPRNAGKAPVLLWPDTFNNYFVPRTAKAAVEVLETAGFRVFLPKANLCCGRPLYDFGMLERAQMLLRQILYALAPAIDQGMPIVGLEPSCVAVFRDELRNFFPKNQQASRLAQQTFLLSEFLERHAPAFELPRLQRKAIVHGHCHHKSIMKMSDEHAVLHRMEIDFQSPAPGCCGMAGSFGFEHDKYEVSAAIGELELLPAVRKAPPSWLVIADGFSCREQIAQGTNRHALHLAEVIQMALHSDRDAADEPYPETSSVERQRSDVETSMKRAGAAVGGAAILGILLWLANRSS